LYDEDAKTTLKKVVVVVCGYDQKLNALIDEHQIDYEQREQYLWACSEKTKNNHDG